MYERIERIKKRVIVDHYRSALKNTASRRTFWNIPSTIRP